MRGLFVLAGLVLMGCDGGGEACDEDGATRCALEAAETCSGGEWVVADDCGANGGTCMQNNSMMEGEAHCM